MTLLPASAKRHLKLPVSRYLLAKWKQCVLMLPCWHWLCRKCYINIWLKCNLSWWHGFCPGHTEDTFRGCALRRLNLKFSTFTLLRFSFTTLAAQWKHGEDANRKNRISKKKKNVVLIVTGYRDKGMMSEAHISCTAFLVYSGFCVWTHWQA